jgi:enhancing lycopene biosynthesis protein 2
LGALFVFADQVAQLPNVTGSITVTSNYVLVTTALIAAKLLKELKNCKIESVNSLITTLGVHPRSDFNRLSLNL